MKTFVIGAEINLSNELSTDLQTFVLNFIETDYENITLCKAFARACINGSIFNHSTRVTKQNSHSYIA